MFWRILRRLFQANPARLFVVLLALGAGAAITAALLNLQVDARRRLTTEFRSLGANVVIAPRDTSAVSTGTTLDEAVLKLVPAKSEGNKVAVGPFLYVLADLRTYSSKPVRAVVAGTDFVGMGAIIPQTIFEITTTFSKTEPNCLVGKKISEHLGVHVQERLFLENEGREQSCFVSLVIATGGAEDSQVFLPLPAAQALAGLPGRVSLIQLSVPGTPQSIERYIAALSQAIPDANVHGIRQFTEAEAKLYNRISGLLVATVALILVLTGLCVMAAMTSAAMERQHDVGLMKALGGPVRRVLRLFLAEAAILGVAGGILGAAAGLAISIWLGKAVFGVAARPRLIVYPVTVALTVLIAVLGAYPLRRLAGVRPAAIFRGDA